MKTVRNVLLSNQFLLTKITACTGLLVLLCIFSREQHVDDHFELIRTMNRARSTGETQPITISYAEVERKIGSPRNQYMVSLGELFFRVKTDQDRHWNEQQVVSIKGTVDANGIVHPRTVREHKDRLYKILVSIPGMILWLIILLFRFSFTTSNGNVYLISRHA